MTNLEGFKEISRSSYVYDKTGQPVGVTCYESEKEYDGGQRKYHIIIVAKPSKKEQLAREGDIRAHCHPKSFEIVRQELERIVSKKLEPESLILKVDEMVEALLEG
jgi:hypothetical protein